VNRLSLAHLTVLDADPLQLIDAAVAGGFDAIGLRIVAPMPTDRITPVIGDEVLIRRIESRLKAAHRLITTAAQPNAGVLIDALHLSRSGGTPADIGRLDPASLAYCQICDARAVRPPQNELRTEAREGRLFPGEGALPLRELLDALPEGIPLGVEAPCMQYANLPPVERGRLCGAATRAFIERYRHAGATP
jgi:hypothetical protein